MSLWSELKQRRITQILISFLVGGWIILQVVDQMVDREVLPRYVYLVALILFGFGIPAALIIGWYHGEKGSQQVTSVEVALLVLLGIGALGSSFVVVSREVRIQIAQSGDFDLARMAVLYFEADDEESNVVAEGLTEDLISRLSRVPELSVVSRNGSRSARAEGMTLEEAAEYLDVGALLHGDVRRSGDELAVNVQLRTRDGIRLASVVVRSPADSILILQDQVAQEVAEEIRAALGEEIHLRDSQFEAPNNGAWLAVARGERAMERARAQAFEGLEAMEPHLDDAEAAFREAAELAPDWATPWYHLSRAAHERGRRSTADVERMESLLAEAEELADEALDRDPRSALAFYHRGTTRYTRYLRQLDGSPQERQETLQLAREDLENAVRLEPSLAEGFATLSHLFYQVEDVTGAALAARQAYQADAFLAVSNTVLQRLVVTNYDLGDVPQSRQWCAEGYRRFPEDFYFTECRLWLMTMDGVEPDVDLAWALRDSVRELMGPRRWEAMETTETLVVAGVIARAGLADSASVVMDRNPGDPPTEAAMRIMNGQQDQAIQLLREYTAGQGGHFGQGSRLMWWWVPLQGNPEFERMRRLN